MQYFFIFIFFFSAICSIGYLFTSCENRDPNLKRVEQGLASKITFQGHSYIVWSINVGGGIVHDPDCACQQKINEK